MDFDLDNVKLLGLGVNLNAKNEISLKSKSTKIKDEITKLQFHLSHQY